MSGKGNRGFADLIAGEGPRPAASRLPPRTGILSSRENRLAELASGQATTRVHELVDPARCRVWEGHNRDYGALTEQTCADLIGSLKAQGRQEVPAIVRRTSTTADTDYEIICGARRHWSVTWLRSHDYPDFRFLIEPRELSDEEAFRIADLENRSRKDLSDHERATDYARAIDRYYAGSQQRMAERLNVTKSWLSRYLELARLPAVVVSAFGSPHVIGISHAARLAPLLRAPATRKQVEAIALDLGLEQGLRQREGRSFLIPAAVVASLLKREPKHSGRAKKTAVKGTDGRTLVQAERTQSGATILTIPAHVTADRQTIIEALQAAFDNVSR